MATKEKAIEYIRKFPEETFHLIEAFIFSRCKHHCSACEVELICDNTTKLEIEDEAK